MESNEQLDLKRYLHLVLANKRLFALTAIGVMALFLVVSYVIPRKYEAKSTVFIERNVINDLIKGMAITPSMEDRLRVLQYTMLSRTLLAKVIDDLDLNPNKGDIRKTDALIAEFQKDTIVKTKEDKKETDMFTVSYRASNPKFASDFVNALVRRYIEENVASKREESYGATRFLEEQIKHFKERLDKAEAELEDFVSKKGVRPVSEGQIRGGGGTDKVRLLESKLSELKLRFTDNHPDVIRLKAEIAEMRKLPASERYTAGRGEGGSAPAGASYGDESIGSKDGRRYSLRGLSSDDKSKLISLYRDRESAQAVHDELIGRLGKSELSKQMEIQDKAATFRIIDPAVPAQKPATPNRVMIILLGMAAGLGAAFGLLIVRDQMDSSIRTVDSLKSLGLPVLAVVPHMTLAADLDAERKRDRRLYKIAAGFGVFLCLMLVLEVAGYSPADLLLDQMSIGVSDVKGMIRKAL